MRGRATYSNRALRDLKRLDRAARVRVVEAIDRYVELDQGDVKRLKGPGDLARLRVGDWRVIYRHDAQVGVVAIQAILHRSQAYRRHSVSTQ